MTRLLFSPYHTFARRRAGEKKKKEEKRRHTPNTEPTVRHQPTSLPPSPFSRPPTCANKFPRRGPYTHDNRAPGLNRPSSMRQLSSLFTAGPLPPEAAGGPAMKTRKNRERRGWPVSPHTEGLGFSPSPSQIAR